MKPTMIRGTVLRADSIVYSIADYHLKHDPLGLSSSMQPDIVARTIIATNGASFAFTRGKYHGMGGAFNYVDEPEAYLVTLDEAEAALKVSLAKRLPLVLQEMEDIANKIVALQDYFDKLTERSLVLMKEDARETADA